MPKKRLGRKRGPDERDIAIGQRVRAMRLEREMSQTALGDRLGVTFQQVQKYEKGVNRLGASRLHSLAEIFGVPISKLFNDSESSIGSRQTLYELVDSSAALRLLQAYNRISNSDRKAALVRLAETIAEEKGRH